ncbi:M67 family metallopeptidase [Paenibacillus sp. YPG26]|uniref:M67 family metallopeptidase n=1 Tax=Paenibacillus sp. YPG26 TaxID=2878915 RepID=UPI00203B3885|nr:M67 family metallopeptidase [Paenibacillus sp. YPG26]USB32222.1 M67 family metallopeptidase [Paenibacillus sp. YPG26]
MHLQSRQLCVITPETRRLLVTHLYRVFPEEGCGALLGSKTEEGWIIDHFQPIRNTSSNPQHTFKLDPTGWITSSFNPRLLGIFHTHPTSSPEPSPEDLLQLQLFGEMVPLYLIASRTTNDGEPDADIGAYTVHRQPNGLFTLEPLSLA